eukprot:Blabericola_migrator_1__3407@NODE_1_length_33786_cov_123_788665_g0_i0_p24_GENE_NODE_1_length_33786_cov_123_788665_g0_i0NODE_1_length_33786_cov_123_788665_g0_i0_p24_ORF_typecomplete_len186_score22_38Ribosomal_L27A/PF00828_19/9_6e03Ribosomal_L27A/PF00828_19/2_3e19Ribosomal_L18/PF17135_4/2_8e03Ribosomal_L18/PF17135_4/5_2e05_NODE_1_length_33786_cov_123_788665_g0_i056926249
MAGVPLVMSKRRRKNSTFLSGGFVQVTFTMPARLSKNRKKRGHVSAGHGRIGKHRKHPGGRGNAGAEHHHRINTIKYHPDYLGKHGFRQFRVQKQRTYCATVNVENLFSLLPEAARDYFTANPSQKPIIDVTRIGIRKVLGTGAPLNHAMIIRAREFSERAKEKITAAGGECQIVGQLAPGTQNA